MNPPTAAGFGAAAALWIVAAGLPEEDQTVASWVGMLAFHLVAALVIRWLYIRPQKPRPPVWSPWLLAIAAGIALLGRFGAAP